MIRCFFGAIPKSKAELGGCKDDMCLQATQKLASCGQLPDAHNAKYSLHAINFIYILSFYILFNSSYWGSFERKRFCAILAQFWTDYWAVAVGRYGRRIEMMFGNGPGAFLDLPGFFGTNDQGSVVFAQTDNLKKLRRNEKLSL